MTRFPSLFMPGARRAGRTMRLKGGEFPPCPRGIGNAHRTARGSFPRTCGIPLAGLSAALLALVAGTPLQGEEMPKAAFKPPPEEAPVTLPVEGMIAGLSALPGLDLDLLSATRARPLFTPGRRPRETVDDTKPEGEPVEEAEKKPDALETAPFDLQVVGIVDGGAAGLALVTQPGAPAPFRVRLSQTVGNWTVTRIARRTVTFRGPDGSEHDVSLFSSQSSWSQTPDGRRVLRLGGGAAGGAAPGAGAQAAPDDPPPEEGPGMHKGPGRPGQQPDGGGPPPPDGPPEPARKVY